MITKNQILDAQNKWGNGIVKIGALKDSPKLCFDYTSSFLNDSYDFKNGDVLFKPTKASKQQFRPTFEMAISYFLGGKDSFCSEDDGFAMKPWKTVKFENDGILINGDSAIAMGNYFFTDFSGKTVKVEYTFGYKQRGSFLFINLHHSSIPFSS